VPGSIVGRPGPDPHEKDQLLKDLVPERRTATQCYGTSGAPLVPAPVTMAFMGEPILVACIIAAVVVAIIAAVKSITAVMALVVLVGAVANCTPRFRRIRGLVALRLRCELPLGAVTFPARLGARPAIIESSHVGKRRRVFVD